MTKDTKDDNVVILKDQDTWIGRETNKWITFELLRHITNFILPSPPKPNYV